MSGRSRDDAQVDGSAPTVDASSVTEDVTHTVGVSGPGRTSAEIRLQDRSIHRIAQFRIEAEMGRGGMGVVYRGFDTKLGRLVAIKLLREGLVEQSPERAQRLMREARAAARLSHPNVVSVYEVGISEEGPFIAMEHVDGENLSVWLHAGERSWQEILATYLEAGRGLEAAHAVGLVHRDVKPDNILVGRDRVRVSDFGIARSSDADTAEAELVGSDALTQNGTRIGTPRYMSPEQRNGQECDPRSDQYSFCLSLFESLFGRLPQQPAATNERSVPSWLTAALRRGLEKNPDERFPSMTALLAALDHQRMTRQRNVALSLSSTLGVLALLLGLWTGRAEARDRCAVAGDELDQVWNDQRKLAVDTAFAAVDSGYAHSAVQRARTELDRYAALWKRARISACRERPAKPSAAEHKLYEARVSCLDRQRVRLDNTVARLERVNRALIPRVAILVTAATKELCDDTNRLSSRLGRPEQASRRVQVEQIEAALDALAPAILSEDRKVVPVLAQLVSRARPIDYAPVLAEALTAYGYGLLRERQDKRAEAIFRELTHVAAASRDDTRVAEAWIALMSCVGVRQGRTADALAMRTMLDSVIARAGNSELLRARYAHTLAGVLRDAGQAKQALEQLELSVRLGQQHLGEAHPNVAASLNGLAMAYMRAGRLDLAERTSKRAIAATRQVFGDEHPRLGAIYANLSIIYRARHRPDDALQVLQRALAIWRASYAPDHPRISMVLHDLADIHRERGHVRRALPLIEEALQRAQRFSGEGSITVARYYTMHGLVLIRLERVADGLAACRKAAAIQSRPAPRSQHHAASLTCIAEGLVAQGRAAEAMAPAEKALALLERLKAPPSMLTQAKLALSSALWKTGKDRPRALSLMEAVYAVSPPADRKALIAEIERMKADLRKRRQVGMAKPRAGTTR